MTLFFPILPSAGVLAGVSGPSGPGAAHALSRHAGKAAAKVAYQTHATPKSAEGELGTERGSKAFGLATPQPHAHEYVHTGS